MTALTRIKSDQGYVHEGELNQLPELLIIREGKTVRHTSHSSITSRSLYEIPA